MGPNMQGMQAPMPMPDLDMVNAGQQGGGLQAFVEQLDPTEWEQLQQQLNGMAPEEQQAFLMEYAANYKQQGQQAQGRMDRADALRTGQPKMHRSYGGYDVAASPVEHLGAGMKNYVAQKNYKQGQSDLNTANTGAQSQLAQMLRMKAGL